MCIRDSSSMFSSWVTSGCSSLTSSMGSSARVPGLMHSIAGSPRSCGASSPCYLQHTFLGLLQDG
eukprot:747991-Amphidinium_carterae.1